MRFRAAFFLFATLLSTAAIADSTQRLEGDVPDAGDFFVIPFEVPPGTAEVEIGHADLSDKNILDWGLEDPSGFRGWGGGNEEPAVVSGFAASRSYLAGPLTAGTWKVVVGKAKVVELPGKYRVDVTLRDAPTLPAQPTRGPYLPTTLSAPGGWFAGDFHVHSRESGDARPTFDELGSFAKKRGLSFVALTDHNTVSQADFLTDAQGRHPEVLFVPAIEVTTYKGHFNALGATRYVDHRVGFEGVTLEGTVRTLVDAGAVTSVNHPVLDLGDVCIGCAWSYPVPAEMSAVEISTGGLAQGGALLSDGAIAFWDSLLARGMHLAAIGGSDDHKAGFEEGRLQSPMGSPTTMVEATALSVDALLAGVRDGRTAVKLVGPEDPMVVLTPDAPRQGDSVYAERVKVTATVTGGRGERVRFVHNGVPLADVEVDADPFEHVFELSTSAELEDRVRAEVMVDGRPRTVTSHLFLARSAAARGKPAPPPESPSEGCGCGTGVSGALLLMLAPVLALRRGRRAFAG